MRHEAAWPNPDRMAVGGCLFTFRKLRCLIYSFSLQEPAPAARVLPRHDRFRALSRRHRFPSRDGSHCARPTDARTALLHYALRSCNANHNRRRVLWQMRLQASLRQPGRQTIQRASGLQNQRAGRPHEFIRGRRQRPGAPFQTGWHRWQGGVRL